VRLSWIDEAWREKSRLIACRVFDPSFKEQEEAQFYSDLMLEWVKACLEEVGLGLGDIFASVSDGGSDVTRLCMTLLGKPWEWCGSHCLNLCIKDGFGFTVKNGASTNQLAHDLIVDIKSTISTVMASHKSKVGCAW
jgi:hypothetical protein